MVWDGLRRRDSPSLSCVSFGNKSTYTQGGRENLLSRFIKNFFPVALGHGSLQQPLARAKSIKRQSKERSRRRRKEGTEGHEKRDSATTGAYPPASCESPVFSLQTSLARKVGISTVETWHHLRSTPGSVLRRNMRTSADIIGAGCATQRGFESREAHGGLTSSNVVKSRGYSQLLTDTRVSTYWTPKSEAFLHWAKPGIFRQVMTC